MKNFEKLIMMLLFIMVAIGAYFTNEEGNILDDEITNNRVSYELSNIPEYCGEIYVEINNNMPEFTEEDMSIEEDFYSELEEGRVRNGNDKN